MPTPHNPLFERHQNETEGGTVIVTWRTRCTCKPDETIGGWTASVMDADSIYERHLANVARQTQLFSPAIYV